MSKINCFLPFNRPGVWEETLAELTAHNLINRVYLFGNTKPETGYEGCSFIKTEGLFSTDTMKKIADHSTGVTFSMVITRESKISFGLFAIERFLWVAAGMDAGMVYSDYYDSVEGNLSAHPVIDYQPGSLRDDFEFGPVLFFNSQVLINAAEGMLESYIHAGLYQLRLRISQDCLPVRIPEYLYSVLPVDTRVTGKKIFDYVDPKNRDIQVEMESAATTHLKEIGAYLKPVFEAIHFDENHFDVEASVIIPVRNRVKTISDAIESVMSQKSGFEFNLIVVDNHYKDRLRTFELTARMNLNRS